jgi:hypothetical protein
MIDSMEYAWPVGAPRLGNTLRNLIFARFFPNLNTRYLTSPLNLPVGYGGLPPVLQQNAGVSQLAGSTTAPAEDPLYGEIDRRDAPLPETTQTGGAVRQARDWIEYWQLKDQGIEVLAPTAAARAASADYQGTTSTTTGNGSMDLGQLITDLGGQYIQARYGQVSPPYNTTTGVYYPPVQATPALGPAAGAGIGVAAGELYDYFMNEDGTMGAKKKCKKRRRRKRLATVSDIADLAALKSILGNGDAFKTWIATHSR